MRAVDSVERRAVIAAFGVDGLDRFFQCRPGVETVIAVQREQDRCRQPGPAPARATPTASGTLLKVMASTRSTSAVASVAIWVEWYCSACSEVMRWSSEYHVAAWSNDADEHQRGQLVDVRPSDLAQEVDGPQLQLGERFE